MQGRGGEGRRSGRREEGKRKGEKKGVQLTLVK